MAKITPGAIISEISGSIANETYSRSKYGAYVKSKLIQTNRNSPAQIAVRVIQAAAVVAWQTLSQSDQAAWNLFAVSQLSKPRLSLRSTLNGYNTFIRFYITRNSYGLTGIPQRIGQRSIGIYSNASIIITSSSITLAVTGNNTDPDIMVVARMSGPRSPGQTTITQTLLTTFLFLQAPNGAISGNLLPFWEAKWGPISAASNQKIFAQLDIVNRATAQKVAIFSGAAIIPAPFPVVAVAATGAGDRTMRSVNGIVWVPNPEAVANSWQSVSYSPSLTLFVAVSGTGVGNRVMTSPDGIVWTSRVSAADNVWRGITWGEGAGLFVAVSASGAGNRVMTSPDGIVWTSRVSAADNAWQSITWSESLNLFVAVGSSGVSDRVMSSPDGIVWTLRIAAAANTWQSVAWSESLNLFVAVSASGVGNRVMTSPDGIVWTSRVSAADNSWLGVAWSAALNLFVAVSSSGVGNRVMSSPDGIVWTSRVSAADNVWQEVVFYSIPSLFVAVSSSGVGNRVMTSPDGIVWTSRVSAADNSWLGIAAN